MQIERLIQIIFTLIDCEQITAKSLAEKLNVSTRTIYRDINVLSVAGIPVLSEKGYKGGISLMSGFSLDKTLFSKEEQNNILQALHILNSVNYPDTEQVLTKIRGLFCNSLQADWLEVDFSYWGSPKDEQFNISRIERAIVNKYVLSFTYYDSSLNIRSIEVEPMKLLFKAHSWYLVAYSRYREAFRTYRLSRMRQIEVVNELFSRCLPEDYLIDNQPYKEEYNIPLFKIRFSPEIAYKVYDEFKEDLITKTDDGFYEVTMRYEINDWTMRYLLSFGKYAKILEPADARAAMKKYVEETLAQYTP